MGIQTTMAVIKDLKKNVKEQHIKDPEQCREALIASIRSKMDLGENAYEFEHRKSVVLVIGVNGVGKTTSIGKLADQLKAEERKSSSPQLIPSVLQPSTSLPSGRTARAWS